MKKLFTMVLVCILLCSSIIPVSAYTSQELIIADNLPAVYDFNDGVAVVSNSSFKYGLVDTKGNIIVEPYYDYMGSASEGILIVGLNVDGDKTNGYKYNGIDKYGAINTNGEIVIPVQYDWLDNCSEGLVAFYQMHRYYEEMEFLGQVLVTAEKVGFLDKTGNVVIPCEYDGVHGGFSGGVVFVEKDGKWGAIDKANKTVVPFAYDGTIGFSDGKTIVQKNGKWGAIDKTGKTVIPFVYDGIGKFCNGMCLVWKIVNGFPKYGYVDSNGKLVIPCTYDAASAFDSNGYATVGNYEGNTFWIEHGVINKNGKIVVPLKYNLIGEFKEGLCYVGQRVDNTGVRYKYGYINYSGELVVPMIYDTAESFSEGLARIGVRNTQIPSVWAFFYGYIDTKGNVIVEPNKYDSAGDFSEGLAVVGENTFEELSVGGYESPYPPKYIFVDSSGKEIYTKQERIQGTFSESSDGIISLARGDGTGAIFRNPLYRESVNALPTSSKVLVNGEEVSFDAYNIKGNNYFKLRDLAYVLNGTQKQFEVTWDGNANAIRLISGKAYTAYGTELAKGDGIAKTALSNNSAIYIDGKPVTLTAYNINGNNYFKLRDIGIAFDFDVSWDGEHNVISIDTSKGYSVN